MDNVIACQNSKPNTNTTKVMCFSMHLSNKLIICMDCPCAYSFNCKNLKRMNEERWNLESLNEDLVFFVLIAFGMDIPNRKEESSYAYI